jgi:sugar/nucleoside kinase (ribokinase family)
MENSLKGLYSLNQSAKLGSASLSGNNSLTIFGTVEISRSRFSNSSVYSELCLGGNGSLAALAASKHTNVRLISVIGSDIGKERMSNLLGEKISVEDVTVLDGESFNYASIYNPDSFELVDEEINFGVYAKYKPAIISKETKDSEIVLFSGSNPRYSLEILNMFNNPRMVGVCTLLYHLKNNTDSSLSLINNADYLFTSSSEYSFLSKELGMDDLFEQFKRLKLIFKTEGQNGVRAISKEGEHLFDQRNKVKPITPLNAGDVFAGTIMGFLASVGLKKIPIEKMVEIAQEESIKVITDDIFYRRGL